MKKEKYLPLPCHTVVLFLLSSPCRRAGTAQRNPAKRIRSMPGCCAGPNMNEEKGKK